MSAEKARADPGTAARVLLRAARQERGWSQSRAAAELARLAADRSAGDRTVSAASLKTQLSRWENGHAEPEPAYRALLGALYGREASDLGLGPPDPRTDDRYPTGPTHGDPHRTLRQGIAEAAALDEPGLALWHEQLDGASRLDRRLGTAGAGAVVDALFDRATDLFEHQVGSARRRRCAGLVVRAALLAGVQARDAREPALAWARFGTARSAAREDDRDDLAHRAVSEQARLLVEAGETEQALRHLDGVDGLWADLVRAEAGIGPGDSSPDVDPEPPLDTRSDGSSEVGGDEPTPPRHHPRDAFDTVAPIVAAEVDAVRHRRAVSLASVGDRAVFAEVERRAGDDALPVRERTEARAALGLGLTRVGDPSAVEELARARAAALRTGSARVIALVDAASRAGAHGTPVSRSGAYRDPGALTTRTTR